MDADSRAPGALRIELSAESDRYERDDPRWNEQVHQLVRELKREVGTVEVVSQPVPGQKGGAEAIILALGTAGVFSSAVEALRQWLGRERTRSLTITMDDGTGSTRRFTVRGSELDRNSFRDLADAAIRQGLHA